VFNGRDSLLLSSCLVLCLLVSACSSSSKNSSGGGGGGGGGQSGLHFTSPATGPTLEATVPPSNPQSVTLTVNQNVTWSLLSGNGSKKPVGTLTNPTATSVTYVAPQLSSGTISCSGSAAPPTPAQDVVAATSQANSSESTQMGVVIVEAPPCIATVPTYAACPPPGTVIPPPPLNTGQVFQVGAFNRLSFVDGGSQVHTPFGVGPFTWTITSGSLPNGLALGPGPDSTSVVINGTAVSSGCSAVGLQITDATGVSSSQVFGIVVVPPSLKFQASSYPDSYVNVSANVGIPYPPTTFTVSGGVPPYTWNYNPISSGPPDFPTGLCLSSTLSNVPSGCTSSSPPASSNIGMVWGTPDPNNINTELNNGGPFLVQLQINDGQQPYPAVALPNLSMTVFPLQPTCFQAPDIQPTVVNGGKTGQGSVPASAYLQGSFAFLARGFDQDGPVAIAGSVDTDGAGHITSGEEDITRSSGSQSLAILAAGSSYSIGGALRIVATGGAAAVYNRGCMTLATSAGTTTTFAFSLGGCTNSYTEGGVTTTNDNACGMKQNSQGQNIAAGSYTTGRIIEFDDSTGQGTRASGILRAQDPSSFSSGLSGLYAFGLSGWNSSGGHYAVAGSTQASSGNLSSAAADIDDAGALSSQLTGGSGTFGSLDANGRAQTTTPLTIGTASLDLVLYKVSSSEAIMITTDSLSSSHPVAGGEAIKTAAPFGPASLQNSHAFYIGGVASEGPDVSIGVLHFDGVGSLTGTVFEDQAGTLGTTAVSAVYTVDANTGRTVLSTPQMGQTLGSHSFVAYAIPPPSGLTRANCRRPASCITGFLVGTDSSAQDGILEFQTSLTSPPPPFGNLYVEGDYVYGTVESLFSGTTNIEGTLTSNSISLSTRNQDASYASPSYCLEASCLLLMPEETLSSSSFTINADGTGTFGGQTGAVTNGNVIFYIDQSPLNLHPTVTVAEQ